MKFNCISTSGPFKWSSKIIHGDDCILHTSLNLHLKNILRTYFECTCRNIWTFKCLHRHLKVMGAFECKKNQKWTSMTFTLFDEPVSFRVACIYITNVSKPTFYRTAYITNDTRSQFTRQGHTLPIHRRYPSDERESLRESQISFGRSSWVRWS